MGETERSCTKVAGKLSELKCSRLCGRTSTMTGPRDPRQDCPSGSVSALARRLETQRLLRVTRKKSMKKRRRRKKRRKKKRNKKFLAQRDVIALMKISQLDIVFLPLKMSMQNVVVAKGRCRPLHTSYIPN